MNTKQILFTKVNTAELVDTAIENVGDDQVLVKTMFSTISCGTERANITGNLNVGGGAPAQKVAVFPRKPGYSSSGIVVEKGKNVNHVEVGDRVVVYWGFHRNYNIVNKSQVVKIEDDSVSFEEAAVSFIASFSLAGMRKTRLEAGESAIVMGLGILGLMSVQFLRAAGAVPIIAVDLVKERREKALEYGADYALDPLEEGFAKKVKELTGGGANVAIEVTGVGKGLDQALDCMAKFGRVSLLGCTREFDFNIDYYRKVHSPGITLVGAHTNARPEFESHPGYFTHNDDIKAILKLCAGGRINLKDIIEKTYSPNECASVYNQLVNDRNFPNVVQFDWSKED